MGADLKKSARPKPETLVAPTSYAGFVEEFDELYACAYQQAYKLLGDRLEAEDLAQEACTRACLRWRRLDNPQSWVVRVTTNLAFDRFRRLRSAANQARGHSESVATTEDRH